MCLNIKKETIATNELVTMLLLYVAAPPSYQLVIADIYESVIITWRYMEAGLGTHNGNGHFSP